MSHYTVDIIHQSCLSSSIQIIPEYSDSCKSPCPPKYITSMSAYYTTIQESRLFSISVYITICIKDFSSVYNNGWKSLFYSKTQLNIY